MDYGQLFSRSFRTWWHHRYLWLLGILGGGDAAGSGFSASTGNFSPPSGSRGRGAGSMPDLAAVAGQVGDWIGTHLGLLVSLGVLIVLLALLYLVVSCITTPALIRAAAEHDAERPFGLAAAWEAGLDRFWPILGLRLLVGLAGLLVLLVVGGLAVAMVAALVGGSVLLGMAAGALTGLAVLVLIPVSIAVGLILIMATRAITLERRSATGGLARGWELLRRRTGRVLLVWLLQLALAIGVGLASGVLILVPAVPLAAIAFAAFAAGGLGAGLIGGGGGLLVLLLVAVAVGGTGASLTSVFWTTAYRRLELDRAPAAPAPGP